MVCWIAGMKRCKLCKLSKNSAFLPIAYFWFLTSAPVTDAPFMWLQPFPHHLAPALHPIIWLLVKWLLMPWDAQTHMRAPTFQTQSLLCGSHTYGRQIFSSGSGSMQLLHTVHWMMPRSKTAFLVTDMSSPPPISQLQFESRSAKLKFSLAVGAKGNQDRENVQIILQLLILSSAINAFTKFLAYWLIRWLE